MVMQVGKSPPTPPHETEATQCAQGG